MLLTVYKRQGVGSRKVTIFEKLADQEIAD